MIVEIFAAAAGGVGLVLAQGRRRARRPQRPSIAGAIRDLRRGHRRKVREIVAMAREHDARHAHGSLEGFTARETLDTYLPETIAAYLAVPPALRKVPRPGRPSPDEEFSRQLRTLRYGLERLREADADSAAIRMSANGAFLDERFGAPPPMLPPRQSSPVTGFVDVMSAYLRRV